MAPVYITLFLILLVALGVAAVVAIGMEGMFRERMPKVANGMAVAARHMNGDAEPPQALVDLLNQKR